MATVRWRLLMAGALADIKPRARTRGGTPRRREDNGARSQDGAGGRPAVSEYAKKEQAIEQRPSEPRGLKPGLLNEPASLDVERVPLELGYDHGDGAGPAAVLPPALETAPKTLLGMTRADVERQKRELAEKELARMKRRE